VLIRKKSTPKTTPKLSTHQFLFLSFYLEERGKGEQERREERGGRGGRREGEGEERGGEMRGEREKREREEGEGEGGRGEGREGEGRGGRGERRERGGGRGRERRGGERNERRGERERRGEEGDYSYSNHSMNLYFPFSSFFHPLFFFFLHLQKIKEEKSGE
jgi:hypothetical protein